MGIPYPEPPAVILVAEDDVGDQILIREVLEAGPISKRIFVVRDGEEAVDFLSQSGRFAGAEQAPRPDLILLDLNMPRLNGKEVLARLKGDESLRGIPVIAFTTSAREDDIAECYALGVNSYLQKPTDFEEFQAALRVFERYWLEFCRVPPRGHPARGPEHEPVSNRAAHRR